MNRCVVVTSHLWRSSAADQLNYVAIDCVANRWPAGRRSKQSNTDSFNSLIQFARRRSAGAWQSLSQRRHCWPVMTAVTCPLQDVTHAPDIEWTCGGHRLDIDWTRTGHRVDSDVRTVHGGQCLTDAQSHLLHDVLSFLQRVSTACVSYGRNVCLSVCACVTVTLSLWQHDAS